MASGRKDFLNLFVEQDRDNILPLNTLLCLMTLLCVGERGYLVIVEHAPKSLKKKERKKLNS